MALLNSEQRADARARFVREWFAARAKLADLDTTELATLISDIDAWLDSNAASANLSITAAIRSKASSQTKFAALAFVALKRSGAI